MAGDHYNVPAPEILRQSIETEIEHLMEVLDYLDPDPDLEDGGDDEPSIGAPEAQAGAWRGLWPEGNDDREQDDFDLEDNGDFEPSLGSLNNYHRQLQWADGNRHELEDEHDGAEPCCEDEGAQCDDEGAVDPDVEGRQHAEFSDYDWKALQADHASITAVPVVKPSTYTVEDWRKATADQASTTTLAAVAVRDLREVMARHGLQPVPHLRVLGGAIMK